MALVPFTWKCSLKGVFECLALALPHITNAQPRWTNTAAQVRDEMLLVKREASAFQKVVASMRIPYYGMKEFVRTVDSTFTNEWLRLPNTADLKHILEQFANLGFPGCIRPAYCSGWNWGPCPTALHWIFSGKEIGAISPNDSCMWSQSSNMESAVRLPVQNKWSQYSSC